MPVCASKIQTLLAIEGLGLDDVVVSYAGAATTTPTWLLSDERQSVIAVTNASGAASINTYDEYGVPGSGNSGRFQYTGQMWLAPAGVYHYRARAYAPGIGRFLQTDPMGYAAGANLYAYVGGDPVNWSDPLGLFECVVGGQANGCTATGLPPLISGNPASLISARGRGGIEADGGGGGLLSLLVTAIQSPQDLCPNATSTSSDVASFVGSTAESIGFSATSAAEMSRSILVSRRLSSLTNLTGAGVAASLIAGETLQIAADVNSGQSIVPSFAAAGGRVAATAAYSALGGSAGYVAASTLFGPEAAGAGGRAGALLGGLYAQISGSAQTYGNIARTLASGGYCR